MLILGLFFTLVMGLILGLIGGGGSLLTVPILVYCFGVPATLATGYSLVIVGASSAVGAIRYHRQQLINWPVALWFSLPSIMGVLISRVYLLPMLPERMAIGTLHLSNNQLILGAFSIMVVLISMFMFKSSTPSKRQPTNASSTPPYLFILIEGLVVGIATGFVGAGGGFMIVPALMAFINLPLKQAIATSLVIISMKSMIGFSADIMQGSSYNPTILFGLMAITFGGVYIGTRLNQIIDAATLRRWFAYLVLVMGLFIFMKEFYF